MKEVLAQTDSDLAKGKRETLLKDARIQKLVNSNISLGNGSAPFSLDKLIYWWLSRANEKGPEKADIELEDYLNDDEIITISALWVYGIDLHSTLTLTPNIQLIKADNFIECTEKEMALKFRGQISSLVTSAPQALLAQECKIPKIHTEKVEKSEHSYLNSISELQIVAQLLNCLSDVYCMAGYATSYLKPHCPPGQFSGSAASYQSFDTIPLKLSNIDCSKVKILPALFENIGTMESTWKEKIFVGLSRLGQAKARQRLSDTMLDLGIALESVLLFAEHRKNDLPGQLHNHFRNRGAWLLGDDFEERLQVDKALKDIYSMRSQVAHTGILNTKSADKTKDKRSNAIRVAEQIFQKLILQKSAPDWSRLVLGDRSILDS